VAVTSYTESTPIDAAGCESRTMLSRLPSTSTEVTKVHLFNWSEIHCAELVKEAVPFSRITAAHETFSVVHMSCF
jgi:hypothetical protein